MAGRGTFYITTPIFYANARPHMGHAYTSVLADAAARHRRLMGDNVYFLVGTDEHGQKIAQSAEKDGKAPQIFVDEVAEYFRVFYAALDISYDQFIRTTDREIHWPGAVKLWERLAAAEDIYKDSYEGLYCVGHEAFLTEKELDAEGKCPDHGTKPEHVKEENYFFKLSRYTDKIKEHIERDELRIFPTSRKNEVLSFLEGGVGDVSFSRPSENLSWGIPVPGDASQTMYVWCDALSNYVTALGYGRGEELMTFWPADYHVIGKDILRFHAVFWPAMLMSAKLPLPRAILVHGLITSGGRKMSKTLGNVIEPQKLIDTYGADAVRYYLCRHVSPFSDSDMTYEGFKEAYNGELANGLGNLVARIMQMTEKYDVSYRDYLKADDELTKHFHSHPGKGVHFYETYEFNKVLDDIWEQISGLDAYIQREEPFKKIKVHEEEARKDIAYLRSQLIRVGARLEPFMPDTAEKIKAAVKANKKPETLFPRMG